MVNKWMRPSWIYGKFVSFHQLDFKRVLICFSVIDSELFGALFSGHSVNFNTLGVFL